MLPPLHQMCVESCCWWWCQAGRAAPNQVLFESFVRLCMCCFLFYVWVWSLSITTLLQCALLTYNKAMTDVDTSGKKKKKSDCSHLIWYKAAQRRYQNIMGSLEVRGTDAAIVLVVMFSVPNSTPNTNCFCVKVQLSLMTTFYTLKTGC